MRHARLALGVAGALLMVAPALAADHEVQMLNKGADGPMVFEPAFLQIEPGDTVTFVPTDKGHNSEAIEGMVPEGAEAWKGKISEEVSVTFTEPGIYGYKCLPHYPLGMVGLIQVGDDPLNLEEAKGVKHPGKADKRMTALFEDLGG
ncbi:pseudoazurin [Aurantimonas sp. C2-6-R+9]|uniref:pseudoazurin n=1 Tax=unclassified Aurantimonas TaxID=2638230 RepID=UPI002E199825|nr:MULTISPECIES: pseudoazurin [unclassified Aurantimonas]MEC5293778.1 pseudoazurin [Aurantimonas sp. C2-3-R2]MEC5383947.1 pseudoazurin [Aurantimonas sp. C2-6-R+9]MEC5414836.1 pseudoazurin [Aurantimonas sp. C2-4-R8]